MTSEATPRDRFAGQHVHVIGLGSWGTGGAVARVLSARGANVTVSDVKSADALAGEIAALADTEVTIHTGEAAYRGLEQADLVVLSPGVPPDIPPLLRARARGVKVVGEIEVAYWIARSPILAVTGTKGKTTTATLIGELLKDAGREAMVVGNIGRPMISAAASAGPDAVLVSEVSSFQLETTESFRPRVAMLLNLFPDHLDRHVNLDSYREAKARIFDHQQPDDCAVINRDEAEVWPLRRRTRARLIPYSLEQAQPEGADLDGGWLRVRGQRICRADAVKLRGRHNLSNALAALAAAQAIGAPLNAAQDTLSRFEGLEHRLEAVGTIDGVLFINDSQATTPQAAIAGLQSFAQPVVLIAGGRSKVHDFGSLAESMARRGASLVAIGEAAAEIAAAARRAGVDNVLKAQDLPEAVRLAYERAQPEGVVLLSPACASFDMFENMAERGRAFKQAVRELSPRERTDH